MCEFAGSEETHSGSTHAWFRPTRGTPLPILRVRLQARAIIRVMTALHLHNSDLFTALCFNYLSLIWDNINSAIISSWHTVDFWEKKKHYLHHISRTALKEMGLQRHLFQRPSWFHQWPCVVTTIHTSSSLLHHCLEAGLHREGSRWSFVPSAKWKKRNFSIILCFVHFSLFFNGYSYSRSWWNRWALPRTLL